MDKIESSETVWLVVRDTEHRFSVWPKDRQIPVGWAPGGFSGSRDECLVHIRQIWTDPRPMSLRTAMARSADF